MPSIETKFKSGQTPWNKNVPMSDATCEKLSQSMRGRVPWNKGLATGPRSEECRAKVSVSLKNRTFTDEHRENLSKALKGRKAPWAGKNWPQTCKKVSDLTFKLADILVVCGFDRVVLEQSFWPYTVDVLLAEEWVAFEADGKYWHDQDWLTKTGRTPNKLTDIERDQRLFERHQLPVVRLSEDEINELHALLVTEGY